MTVTGDIHLNLILNILNSIKSILNVDFGLILNIYTAVHFECMNIPEIDVYDYNLFSHIIRRKIESDFRNFNNYYTLKVRFLATKVLLCCRQVLFYRQDLLSVI